MKQVELPKSSISLAEYKDKTLLLVNVASKCGKLTLSRRPQGQTKETQLML